MASLPLTRDILEKHFAAAGLQPWQRTMLHDRLAGHVVDEVGQVNAKAAADVATLTGALSAADSLRVDPKRRPSLDRIMATLRRFGYDAKENEVVDRFRLDQVLAKSNDITGRLALKAEMRQLNLLPRVS